MRSSRMRTILLASGAAVALAATSGPAAADELQTLRDQLSKLQSKVAKIEADRAVKSRKVVAAAAVEAGDRPKTWKLPGTNTSMRIGGYVKLDIIWDFAGRGFQFHFPAFTPANGSAAQGASNGGDFRFLARQSRLFVITTTPTDWGTLMTRFEGDFYGSGGSAFNPGLFRLRHALGCLGPVCAGQTWSAWMPVWAGLPTLDFGGAQSAIFVRHAILKFTHNFGGGWVAHIGLEDPLGNRGFANLASGGGDFSITTAGATLPVGAQKFPDVVGGLFYNWKGGRAWVGGLLRQEETDNGGAGGATVADEVIGWGVAFAAAARVHKRVRVGTQWFYGKAVNSYVPGLFSLVAGGPNAVNAVMNAAGSLQAVTSWGGYAWVQVSLTDTIRTGVVWAYAESNPDDEVGKAALGAAGVALTKYVQSVHANVIWSPVPAVNIGIEYSWHQHGRLNANDATLHRIQVAFQYLF